MNNFPEKYINPFTDFGFKKLFGTVFNKALLIDFLNQVLDKKETVQDLTYLNSEALGNTKIDRTAIFDLYCENKKGEKFIIELQNARQEHYKDRSIFYATFPVQSQAPKGRQWDYRLKAVYTIGILNFNFPEKGNEEVYRREVLLIDKDTHKIFYDKLTFIYLEMPKFKKGEDELVSRFDKWLYVLKNLPKFQERPRNLQEKIFERLFEEAEIAKLRPEDMKKYEESLKIYRDNYSTLEYAKKEGREEGREEGMREKQIEIAKMLKKNGASVELIAKSTGLTQDQVERLSF